MIDCANESQNNNKYVHSMPNLDSHSISYFPSKLSFSTKFEDKFSSFRAYLVSMKISFLEGCDTIHTSRENVLQESMKRAKEINFFKELKIDFQGEVSYDAGGIIREWFMIIISELESKELGLFEKSDCDDYSFVPKRSLAPIKQNFEYFDFIGFIIAKALLENITINLCFNKIIYKMLINEPVHFEDLKYIDKQLYLSLKDLRNYDPEVLKDLCLYYVYEYKNEKEELISEEIIPNGSEILVNDINDYIEKRIQFMMSKYEPFIAQIRKTLFSVRKKIINIFTQYIDIDRFKNFNSNELELLINGKPFIDILEWKNSALYKGKYTNKSKVIEWFWEALATHSQEELSKFLQFCTGSSRVPIGGFNKLESNRGEIARFTINSVTYQKKLQNFIKAHTCFNRIDLPMYKHQQEVGEAIQFVLNNEIIGFGID